MVCGRSQGRGTCQIKRTSTCKPKPNNSSRPAAHRAKNIHFPPIGHITITSIPAYCPIFISRPALELRCAFEALPSPPRLLLPTKTKPKPQWPPCSSSAPKGSIPMRSSTRHTTTPVSPLEQPPTLASSETAGSLPWR